MANLHRKVQGLREGLYCPEHPQQALLCFECDLPALPGAEMEELVDLLEQAGYLDREPFARAGICWRCHRETLACLVCLDTRGEPRELDHMDATAWDLLYALGAKLVPPWLNFEP
jgi:hypothetical protein